MIPLKPVVLVLGASGQVGKHVVEALKPHQHELTLRVCTRTPEGLQAFRAQGLDAVLLNLDQPSTFPAALRGVDRLLLITGYSVAMLAQSKTLVDAARKAAFVAVLVVVGPGGHFGAKAGDGLRLVGELAAGTGCAGPACNTSCSCSCFGALVVPAGCGMRRTSSACG